MNSTYVLKYTDEEINRLRLQAKRLHDPRLDDAIRRATRILDLGCGPATLVKRIRELNSSCYYLGLDADKKAIESAKSLDPNIEFKLTDITKLPLPDLASDFDLIICRLVLWAIPNVDVPFIRQLASHLAPGGVLYAFEPDDLNLTTFPVKPQAEELARRWQKAVLAKGQDPFIGRRLYTLFVDAGLSPVDAKPMPFAESGQNPESYLAMMKSLKSIFSSQEPQATELSEFDHVAPHDLVVEHHFSVF